MNTIDDTINTNDERDNALKATVNKKVSSKKSTGAVKTKAFAYKMRTSEKSGNPNYVVVLGDFARGAGGKIRTLRNYKSAAKLAEMLNNGIQHHVASNNQTNHNSVTA